jgi:hypothetical protein
MTKQSALIARWHTRVVETGTRLLAVSCFDNNRFVRGANAIEDDICSFEGLRFELMVEVIDLLHDFSFFLRKVIERAELVEQARQIYPHLDRKTVILNQAGPEERAIELSQESLWWILGRVIHSRSVLVLGGEKTNLVVYSDGKTREYEDSRCYVEFESDWDADEGKTHVLHVPSLVKCYVSTALRHAVDEIVRANTI